MTAIEYSAPKGLPKKTKSVCPECGKPIDADIVERDGKVYMDKTCSEHGDFSDVYWSDAEMYLEVEKYAADGTGFINTKDPASKGDNVSFLIKDMKVDVISPTTLANIDLTNRCNMNCPICFANANQAGYVYEPDFETVVDMLKMLRSEEPIKCTAVQFSGGEPTVYPKLPEIIKIAKELGFAQVQVATNGLKLANDFEYLKKIVDAGLNTFYLSFDGMSDDIYLQARDRKMFDVKLKVLENLRKLEKSPSVVLVPTVVKGMNDKQIGQIVDFALANADIIRGVNFQPVAFTGRITNEELSKGRFTLPDLVREMEEQTGYTKKSDWYPVPVIAPISKFASIMIGEKKVNFTTHPHCGIATYIFQDDKGNVVPITRFMDAERLSRGLWDLSEKAEKSRFKKWYMVKAVSLLNKCVKEEGLPEGMTKKSLRKMLMGIMSDKSKKTLAAFSWRMMLISGMHFQDSYNYDVERVKRCAIHYATPDMRVIPFCAFNGGPEYRAEIEKKFSIPLDEWRAKNKDVKDE